MTGPRAPEALLRVGQALGRLGQGPEACVTLAEVGNRFPGHALGQRGLAGTPRAGVPLTRPDLRARPARSCPRRHSPQAGLIGVAVSGGSDSLGALHVVARVAGAANVRAATVDHRLRPEAAAEARLAGEACARLGVAHAVLAWEHGAVRGNLMAAARAARHALLARWACGAGVAAVVLGHTADDQAETVLMALARASGLDGLSGMRPGFVSDGAVFLRPFLGVTRAALRAVLTDAGQGWIEDPTNADTRYARVRARRALTVLQPLGITVEGVAAAAAHLRAERQGIEEEVEATGLAVTRAEAGSVAFDSTSWREVRAPIGRRIMLRALAWVARADHAPRAGALARLLEGIAAGQGGTLGGCRVVCRGASFRVLREERAVAGLACAVGGTWDRRWRMEPAEGGASGAGGTDGGGARGDTGAAPGLEIRALGPAGLALCKGWRETGIPREALVVSPAVWEGERLVAAPLAGWGQGWRARIVAPGQPFAVSH